MNIKKISGVLLLILGTIGIILISTLSTKKETSVADIEDGDIVLVANDTYNENLNFKGKNINLSSRYVFNNSIEDIDNTIIDGSNPIHPDTASCVLFVNEETEMAIIQGFTITGGTGTKWQDEHGAGLFTEGGGILVQYASPTIQSNKIMYNSATNTNGTVSAGGGAIRCGDSNPLIQNNLIAFNQGRYGGGIVLNYSGAIIRNNIIDHNLGGEDFGGGGIWSAGSSTEPKIFQNNTITNNHSVLGGGGVRLWSSVAEISNSIIWGNMASFSPQIQGNTGVFSYCDIEGGWPGEENIDADPMFEASNFYLMTGSPCIDAGNPDISQNDPEDMLNPDQAAFPSMGMLRNDMGAFGGPNRKMMVDYITNTEEHKFTNKQRADVFIYPNPVIDKINIDLIQFSGDVKFQIFDLRGKCILKLTTSKTNLVELDTKSLSPGLYTIMCQSNQTIVTKKLIKL